MASRLQHAIPHDLFEIRLLYSYADYFCAYGEAAKRELVGQGRPADSVFVVGNPGFDHITRSPERRPVPVHACTVMFAQQDNVERRTELAFLDDLARICCDESGYRLIIKLHPLSALKAGDLRGCLPDPRRERHSWRSEVRGMPWRC